MATFGAFHINIEIKLVISYQVEFLNVFMLKLMSISSTLFDLLATLTYA